MNRLIEVVMIAIMMRGLLSLYQGNTYYTYLKFFFSLILLGIILNVLLEMGESLHGFKGLFQW